MWIHILIFMVILGVFLAGKMGRLPPEAGNPGVEDIENFAAVFYTAKEQAGI